MPRLFGVFLLFVILKVNFQNICYILEYYHFRGADCNNIPTDIKAAHSADAQRGGREELSLSGQGLRCPLVIDQIGGMLRSALLMS